MISMISIGPKLDWPIPSRVLASSKCGKNLAWTIEVDPRAARQLKRLGHAIQREITAYLQTRIASADSPRHFGKPLRGAKFGLWRYRVRDCRIICKIEDFNLVVLVIDVGHRSTIYK